MLVGVEFVALNYQPLNGRWKVWLVESKLFNFYIFIEW